MLISLTTYPAQAAQRTCPEVIQECRQVIKDAKILIKAQDDHTSLLTEQNERLQTALDAEAARIAHDETWYRDPRVIVPLAFVLGFIAASYAERH